MNAMVTNASQPKIAVFLWLALHRPICAARLVKPLALPTVESTVCLLFAGPSGSFWMMRVFMTPPLGLRGLTQPRSRGRPAEDGRLAASGTGFWCLAGRLGA